MSTSGLSLDILARVESSTSVTFWRPQATGESGPSESFGTRTDWVQIPSSGFSTTLGSRTPVKWVEITLTVFTKKGVPTATVNEVFTPGTTKLLWTQESNDRDLSSPSFVSPSFALGSGVQTGVSVNVDGQVYSLPLSIDVVQYNDREPPPVDPIIKADLPTPQPNPIGRDVLVASGLPQLPSVGPIDVLVNVLRRNPRLLRRGDTISVAFTRFLDAGPLR